MSKMCLSNGGKHRWKYRDDSMLGRVRECQGCGTQQQRQASGRWTAIGSTRWVPLTPAERDRQAVAGDGVSIVAPRGMRDYAP